LAPDEEDEYEFGEKLNGAAVTVAARSIVGCAGCFTTTGVSVPATAPPPLVVIMMALAA
jgi:hypothetical protein